MANICFILQRKGKVQNANTVTLFCKEEVFKQLHFEKNSPKGSYPHWFELSTEKCG